MNNLFLNKINFLKFFLIFSFIFCWASISTNVNDIYKIYQIFKFNTIYTGTDLEKKLPTLIELINSLRQLLIFLIFPFLLILNLLRFEKKNFKENLPFFCLFLYFIFQIPGLIFTKNTYLNLGFVISSLNILLILNLTDHFFNKKKYMIFIYINLFFLVLIIFLNRSSFIDFWNSDESHILYVFRDAQSENFFGKSTPRSTGMSRTVLLIYIISIFAFKTFFHNHRYFKYFFYLVTAMLILLYQSRTILILGLVFIIFSFFGEKNKNIFKYLVLNIIIPIVFLYSFLFIKNYETIKTKNNYSDSITSIEKNYLRPIDTSSFSSGRVKDWETLIHAYNNDFKYYGYGAKYYGYGAQADRFLINQTASNGIIYAITSSGIIGIFFYFIFIFSCLAKIFNHLVLQYKNCSAENRFSSIIILIILLRSLLESSFSVFGIDLIIICTFYKYLSKKELLVKYAN